MSGENINAKLEEKLAQVAKEREAIAKANATPLPGALAEAFSPCQNIVVDNYTVRPFYDMDFEILQMCGHPMALDSSEYFKGLGNAKVTDLRGKDSWVVCWLLTNDVDTCDEVSAKGKEAVIAAARKVWGRKQLGEILKVQSACFEQFARNFSTVVGLVEADKEDGEAAPKG